MIRILTYKIEKENEEITIKEFLKNRNYPSSVIALLKRIENGITVNGIHVFVTYKLKIGDELIVKVENEVPSEQILPLKMDLDIVFEDEDLIVINKEAGIASHPSSNHFESSLASGVCEYYKGKNFVYRIVNRLDRDTSGLLIIAKNQLSAAILSKMVREKEIKREYLAIVRYDFPFLNGSIEAPIGRANNDSIIERMVNFENGDYAKTNFQKIEYKNGHSLIALVLETGRTHQIRVHLKHKGYPIIGDFLYNPDYDNIKRQALHSHKLEFLHPITGEEMKFSAEMPKDMAVIFE